jgi:hypothetical protein
VNGQVPPAAGRMLGTGVAAVGLVEQRRVYQDE